MKNNLLLFLVVIGSCIVGFGGYYLYETNYLNKASDSSSSSSSTSSPKDNNETPTNLDLTSTAVIDLYNLITIKINNQSTIEPLFYQNKLITLSSISSEDQLRLAYFYASQTNDFASFSLNSCEDIKSYPSFVNYYNSCLQNGLSSLNLSASITINQTFLNYDFQHLFGSENNLTNKSFSFSQYGVNCDYNESQKSYLCLITNSITPSVSTNYNALKSAQQYSDRIEITDYYASCITKSDNTLTCYADSKNQTFLKDNITLDSSGHLPFMFQYAQQYKHIFKLDSNGKYYWYSTEPLTK